MSQPADPSRPRIPAAVIPRLTAAAAQIAASYGERSPASIAAVATTRAKALDVICKGAKTRDGESVHVYAVVMTGRFITHRGPPNSPRRPDLPWRSYSTRECSPRGT
jgi:hypothetical protein